jgi:hypothetical protein
LFIDVSSISAHISVKEATRMNTCVFPLFVALLSTGAAPVPPKSQVEKLAQARAKAAQHAYGEIAASRKYGGLDSLKFGDLELRYVWSKHLLEAERDAAPTRKEAVAAFRAHLSRMEALEKEVKEGFIPPRPMSPYEIRGRFGRAEVAAAALYRTEAEYWLERAKAKK